MPIFVAEIDIMPLKELLDPQGKAVTTHLKDIDLPSIDQVRIGKHITMQVVAIDKSAAHDIAQVACQKLLSNPIMESFQIRIEALN
jgi:phosphoribosylformylglycinamidine synthase